MNALFYLQVALIWYFYCMILIFFGGVIVIFCYASSCTTNFRFYEKGVRVEFIGVRALIIFLNPLHTASASPLNTRGCFGIKNILDQTSQGAEAWIGLILTVRLFIIVKLVKLDRGPLKSKQT